MSAVDAAAIHSGRHLFAHGSPQPEGPPTVSPTEVVISSPYSSGAIHPSVLEEDPALHHDKDFEPLDLSHDPSIQPGESTAASIQVLDDVPEHIGVTTEDMVSSDDGQDWTEGDSQEHKRVKVYELVGSHWEDQGTAFCYGHFDESTNEAQLIARSETDLDNTILCTTIRSCDVYQRQQETLIVWTEPDGVDYALSFQEAEGCAEVWNFIAEVQQHMKASEDHGFGPMSGTGPDADLLAASKLRGSLPEPRMNCIPEIDRIIKILSRATAVKEKMCEWMQREGYIVSLIEVFTKSEDLESLNDLHALCRCLQTILLLNDHTIYEHILDDRIFTGVMGILEYDPEFPNHKANYREFLRQNTHFHAPIPIRDEAIERKIHHTYRLQFIKDVVLARVLDDSTFNVINSCILFNQMDIINHVQHDRFFLAYVVQPFLEEGVAGVRWWRDRLKEFDDNRARSDESMDVDGLPLQILPSVNEDAESKADLDANRKSIVLMLQHLCAMGKNVQLPTRLTLFRNLIDRAILFPVQWALSQDESDEQGKQAIAAAGEILSVLLDHDINGVRGFVLRQMTEADSEQSNTLLLLMCKNMVRSRDLAVQSQIGDALRLMLEIPLNDPNDQASQAPLAVKLMQRAKDDPGVEKFLEYFYKSCIDTLYKPFGDIPEFRQLQKSTLPMSKERTNLFLYLCDLLCNFALQHSFRSHFFLLSSSISTRIASLLSCRDKHLRLAAFRFFRVCLRINNRNLFNHLTKLDILQPIIDLSVKESGRDNLISSSCQEFFDHMRKENIKDLISHCMTKHEAQIRKLAETPLGGPRFSALIRRWEMNVEPLPEIKEEPETKPEKGLNGFRWGQGQGRGLNRDEERYFSEDGPDEDDQPAPLISSPSITSSKPSGSGFLKRKRSTGNGRAGGSPQMTLPRTLPIGNLVGYGGDDDDDDDDDSDIFGGASHLPKRRLGVSSEEGNNASGPPATPRLSHRRIGSQSQTFQPLPSLDDDDEDDEDTLLESLVTGPAIKLSSTPSTTKSASSPTSGSPDLGLMKMGEKRRRGNDEDDDDEWMLERLATKAKRISNVVGNCGESADGGPKKIKLILNKLGSNLSPPSQTPASGSDGG